MHITEPTDHPYRYVIYAMSVACCVVCYGDRAALSVGMHDIAQEFHLSHAGMGWVLSSFLWSYFILNLPSAILLDRFGPRRIGALAVALWSLAMILGSLSFSVMAFAFSRILLGAGEAPTFSLGNTIAHVWAPLRERGAMMTAFVSGIPIGLAGGALAGAWLIQHFGWRAAFSALGALGLVWSVAWLWLYPRESQNTVRHVRRALPNLATLLASRPFIGIVIAQCCGNYANFLLMSWLPLMLRQILHLSLVQSGLYTALVYLAAAILSMIAGRIGDLMMRGKRLETGARRLVGALYYLLAASMGVMPFLHSGWTIVPLLGFALAFVMGGTGSNMTLMGDLLVERELIGSVTGFALTFSNGLGIAAPVLTGYLKDWTGSFDAGWVIASCVLLTGSLCGLLIPRGMFHARPQ